MSFKVPQVSPSIGVTEIENVVSVMRDGWLTEGARTKEFSSKLNELIGTPYGVFAPNGTFALSLALLAAGIGPGDEVLVPDVTFLVPLQPS